MTCVPRLLLIPFLENEVISRQLTEMAVYLLVWGEAGNVRFMPEAWRLIERHTNNSFTQRSGLPPEIGIGPSQTKPEKASVCWSTCICTCNKVSQMVFQPASINFETKT